MRKLVSTGAQWMECRCWKGRLDKLIKRCVWGGAMVRALSKVCLGWALKGILMLFQSSSLYHEERLWIREVQHGFQWWVSLVGGSLPDGLMFCRGLGSHFLKGQVYSLGTTLVTDIIVCGFAQWNWVLGPSERLRYLKMNVSLHWKQFLVSYISNWVEPK